MRRPDFAPLHERDFRLLFLSSTISFTGSAFTNVALDRLSRVYSYDALGSAALIPIGLAIAGPVAEAIGTRATLFAAGTMSLSAALAVLLVHDVRTLRRRGPVAVPEPALEPAT